MRKRLSRALTCACDSSAAGAPGSRFYLKSSDSRSERREVGKVGPDQFIGEMTYLTEDAAAATIELTQDTSAPAGIYR
jgi:hypothetical protein